MFYPKWNINIKVFGRSLDYAGVSKPIICIAMICASEEKNMSMVVENKHVCCARHMQSSNRMPNSTNSTILGRIFSQLVQVGQTTLILIYLAIYKIRLS